MKGSRKPMSKSIPSFQKPPDIQPSPEPVLSSPVSEKMSSSKKVLYTLGSFLVIIVGYLVYKYFKKANETKAYENSPAVKSAKKTVQKATSICQKCPSNDPLCTPEVNEWVKTNCKNGTYNLSITGALDKPLCIATDWSPYTVCSATCGGGIQKRKRTVLSDGVEDCPYEETRQCNTQQCSPEDCIMSEWKEGECSVKCGTGVKKLTRSVLTPAKYGGACGVTEMETECTQEPCCTFLGWGEWSDCSEPCGPGIQIRRMNMTGMLCPDPENPLYIETRECNKEPCCTDMGWNEWSVCSATCGPGTKTRRMNVTGLRCPDPEDPSRNEVNECTNGRCCTTGAWSEWSACSDICGGGTQTRTRTLDGLCGPEVVAIERRVCNTEPCCTYTEWGTWSDCSAECSGGFQTRRRDGTGPRCPPPSSSLMMETRMCNSGACCIPLGWGEWSKCTTGCKEMQTRILNVTGPKCPPVTDPSRFESRPCITGPCCDIGEWSAWSTCTKPCEGGYTERTRSITGTCDNIHVSEIDVCNTGPCCVYDASWSAWSSCSGATCGTGGIMVRTRGATGPLCPPPTDPSRFESKACNTGPCCVIGQWSTWGACSRPCGGGTQTRSRSITSGCPVGTSTVESQACNTQACCTWGNWSAWTPCSATCGKGSTQRTRDAWGLQCPPLSDPTRVEYAVCDTGITCPRECKWTQVNSTKIIGGTVTNSNPGYTLGLKASACCADPNCNTFTMQTPAIPPVPLSDPSTKLYASGASTITDPNFITYIKNGYY